MWREINQRQRTSMTWYHLYEESKLVKIVEEESRMVVARYQGLGEQGSISLIKGYKVLVIR